MKDDEFNPLQIQIEKNKLDREIRRELSEKLPGEKSFGITELGMIFARI